MLKKLVAAVIPGHGLARAGSGRASKKLGPKLASPSQLGSGLERPFGARSGHATSPSWLEQLVQLASARFPGNPESNFAQISNLATQIEDALIHIKF